MQKLNKLAIGLLLTMPVMASATTITRLNSPVIAQDVIANNYTGGSSVTIGNTGSAIMEYTNNSNATFTFNSDSWIVDVGAGESAQIDFSTISNVSAFAVAQTQSDFSTPVSAGALSYSGLLGAGIYYFTAAGSVASGSAGSYQVATTVSAVPVPAAIWFMGSALTGLIAVRKRQSLRSA